VPSSEEEWSEHFEKDKRAARIHVQNFEYKFCALVFLRATNKGQKFKLVSNVKGLGDFDDVVVEYLDDSSRKKHIFLQLKSKVKQHITMQLLLGEKGDFSLRKYYDLYIQIEEKFNCREEEVKVDGRTDESQFIIYTNADVGEELKSNKDIEGGEEEFLMTGGSVLQFNKEEHKPIYEHLQELPKHREFLSRIRIFYNQADEKEMDCHIKPELQQSMKLPESELDLTYMCFIDFVKDWWPNFHYFLEDTNSKENDPLRKTKEKVRTTLVAKALDQRKFELDDLSITYKDSAITDMEQMIGRHKALLIFTPGRSTTLTTVKIHQMLSATKHIILNLQQLICYKTEVMLAWKSMFDVLVLESDSSAEVSVDSFIELNGFLNNSVAEKKFIFISNNVDNIQQINELHRTFNTNLTQMYDVCKFTDIIPESQKFFLDKIVYFQGVEVKLSTIIKNDDVGVLNTLDCDSISFLLENEKPLIGIRSEDRVEYYIDRTLQRNRHAEAHFPAQGEIRHALGGGILQEMRDSSPHLDENLERETDTVWKPSTLIDGEGQIIFIKDEPGMGKSTFLTHLATETLERHPDLWIVRVNINKYTRILHELKTNGCDQKGIIKLLTKAAQIKESDDVLLQGLLFNYTYNSTGNMAVLIDGVDEVSPHYTEEVIQVLKILSKTKIKRIWVTSRNSVRDQLETEFQCQSYSLVPFSEEDQKCFLVKFWKETCPQIEDDYLDNLANQVVKLSTEHLTVQAKQFVGIPLQSWLLAEMFEGSLKQCTTAGTVELPEHINVVMLYDFYVEKKCDIYLSEKKKSDQTNANALTDDNTLYKTFIYNHMAAALVAILSTYQLKKLADKTIAERVRIFLQKITEGIEKTGIIIDDIEGRPIFQHHTLAEYFVTRWLCDNFQNGQTFMRDHLFESGFGVVRSMVDRILADKCPLHEAVLNSNTPHAENLLKTNGSINQKDRGRRTPLHVAVSCRSPELIRLFLEHGADVSCVDTFLGLSPVEYAVRMNDWEVLSLMMEKRPEIREQVLNENNKSCMDPNVSALRAAAKYGHNDLLRCLIGRGNCVNMLLPGDSGTLLQEAARGNHIHAVRTLVDLGANCDIQDANGKTALHVSAEMGSLEVAKFLVVHQEIPSGEDEMKDILTTDIPIMQLKRLNVHDKDGNTPLHLAAAAGNTNTVHFLLSAGSDLESCNTHGEYPLTLAARYGRNDTVSLLLQSCSAVECEEIMTSALTAAIVAGQVDTTALLLGSGAVVSGGENEKPIHVASRMGHKEIVTLLLHYGASLTSLTQSGNTALHLASEEGHLSLVMYLVELQRDGLYSLNYENETPLHLATENRRDQLVTYFAENGCNINAASAGGYTCLHVACENGHYTTVECLLKHGAEVNAMNSADQTPLHIAACQGQTKIVELLFLHNANFSLQDEDGITALLAASMNGHQDTVFFIVQQGGNIEDTDGKGNTIAHFAVENDNLEMLKFLSKQGANLEIKNSDGDTPLLKAVREGRNRMVKYLVAKQSDINSKRNDGMRPLDVAILKCNLEITHLLLKKNARSGISGMHMVAAARLGFLDTLQRFVDMGDDINVKADNGESPLHSACKSGQVATVQYLCEHGAILDLQDNNSNTALLLAVSKGHLDVTRVLVEKGANLCAADASGSTALHIAAKGGHLNIVQYLADSFSPIDIRNANNETALLVAAAEGHEKIVRVLIEQGAGIGVRDIEGKTALDTATEKGYFLIIQLLKDRAEGRKIVCSDSHTAPQTDLICDNFQHLQKAVNTKVSMDRVIQKNEADTAQMIKTREPSLEISNNRCALHTAAENGNCEQVERLVEAGAALDYGDTFGRTALWCAASRGHKYITRLLLANGSCTNIADCEGMTPIEIAAREGQWDVVDEFLEYDPIIRHEGIEYLTSQLYEASESGEQDVVDTILKCGISVNTTNQYGHTPLHVAAMSGQTEITRILLRSGANANIANNGGKVPLIVAAENGHVEVIRNLLSDEIYVDGYETFSSAALSEQEVIREVSKDGASVVTHNENGLKSLGTASLKEEDQFVPRSLNYGGNVDITDEDGSTPLYVAALNGHIQAVRELLKHGAKLECANKNGWTPFNAAISKGHLDVVRELFKHGAKVESEDKDGRTPLYGAALNGHVEVIQELLKHGANVDRADKDGQTPLCSAVLNGNVKVVQELLKHGSKVEIAKNDGQTPLYIAASNGDVEVVQELFKHDAEVESVDKDGRSPLYTAALNGHVEVVRELLKHGANVERADKDGQTPLCSAVLNGHVKVVRELFKHGAKVGSADNDGRTPLYNAALNGHLEVVHELLKHGAQVQSAEKDGQTPLYSAALNGHVEVFRELLKHGAKVESADKDGRTPLHGAALNGHAEVVRELLNYGAKVGIADKDGRTPLYSAASNGHVEVVRELLKCGAKLESADKDGRTPLYTGALNGKVKVVQELLKYGAKVESADKDGQTPLYSAASNGNMEVVRELLQYHAKIESADKDGRTPLYSAALNGNVEVLQELLEHGAMLVSADRDGRTPLCSAALNGHVEVVRELLKHGAKLESADKDGRTPLYSAALKGHLEVVQELLKHGAKVESANNYGWTTLYSAVLKGHLKVVQELLKHGAQVESADKYGWTPLNASASNGHLEFVRELLKHGAKLESADKEGRTPLYSAAFNGHVEVVRELLKHGAKVDIAKNDGRTPLYSAALNGDVEVVRELLKHGAQVESADKDGRTPLYSAAINGHMEVVRELLKHGANVESVDNDGRTPLYSTALNGHVEVVQELLKYGTKESAKE